MSVKEQKTPQIELKVTTHVLDVHVVSKQLFLR